MKRSIKRSIGPAKRQKVDSQEIRNYTFNQIDELKRSSSLVCIKFILENPNAKIYIKATIKRSRKVIKDLIAYYSTIRHQIFSNAEFNILSNQSKDQFIKNKYDIISKILAFSGITNDMSKRGSNYKTVWPDIVSAKDHAEYFTEPLPGDFACMHNDSNSMKSNCLANQHHGITLRASPRYKYIPKTEYNPILGREEVVFEKKRGICIYCERYLINHFFQINKTKNLESEGIVNPYRYHSNVEGEYSSSYMLSHTTPMKFGICGMFPKFKRDAFVPRNDVPRMYNGKIRYVRGLVEKDYCFHK
jgi:hypothetical protein